MLKTLFCFGIIRLSYSTYSLSASKSEITLILLWLLPVTIFLTGDVNLRPSNLDWFCSRLVYFGGNHIFFSPFLIECRCLPKLYWDSDWFRWSFFSNSVLFIWAGSFKLTEICSTFGRLKTEVIPLFEFMVIGVNESAYGISKLYMF